MTSSAYNEREKQMLAVARRLRLAVFKDLEQRVCSPATANFLGALNADLREAATKTPVKAATVANCIHRLILAKDPAKLAKTAQRAQGILAEIGSPLLVQALVADAKNRVSHDSKLVSAMRQIARARAELQALKDLV